MRSEKLNEALAAAVRKSFFNPNSVSKLTSVGGVILDVRSHIRAAVEILDQNVTNDDATSAMAVLESADLRLELLGLFIEEMDSSEYRAKEEAKEARQ